MLKFYCVKFIFLIIKIYMINKVKALEEFKTKRFIEKKDILINLFEKMLIYKPELSKVILLIKKIFEINLDKYNIILDNLYGIILDSIKKVDEINENESKETFEKAHYFLKEIKSNELNESKISEQDLENMLNQI